MSGLPSGTCGKEPACQCSGSIPGLGRSPGRCPNCCTQTQIYSPHLCFTYYLSVLYLSVSISVSINQSSLPWLFYTNVSARSVWMSLTHFFSSMSFIDGAVTLENNPNRRIILNRILLPFFNLFFYWTIIALQNFVVFCQTSTWINHRYAYIPSF